VNNRLILPLVAFAAAALLQASSALGQRQPPSPEQRIERLERQLQQVQRQVFPRGRPADTAGFSGEPAATQSSVATLDQRLDALERQMTDNLRQSEENGHRLQTLEGDLGRLRTEQEQRISALEQRAAEAAATVAVPAQPLAATTAPSATTPKPKPQSTTTVISTSATPAVASDPGEEAYSQGFHLFDEGRYDNAIASLKSFVAAYPKHKRVSYANNLIGRSMLAKGDANGAAAVLLANYRNNPDGARAQDSLLYLAQALMQLGEPGKACNVYAELDTVYGSKVRADLKKQIVAGKAQAQCS
jgi:TolA-binding protein